MKCSCFVVSFLYCSSCSQHRLPKQREKMNEQEKKQVTEEVAIIDAIFNTIKKDDKTDPETKKWLDEHFVIMGVGF